MDTDGNYWCAHIHAGAIAKYDPRGRLERTIELPVRHPTMCTFGGTDLDRLFITTSKEMLSAAERKATPLAGCIFEADPGVSGLPEPKYSG